MRKYTDIVRKYLIKKDDILLPTLVIFTIRDALKGCGYGNAVQKALEEKGAKSHYG